MIIDDKYNNFIIVALQEAISSRSAMEIKELHYGGPSGVVSVWMDLLEKLDDCGEEFTSGINQKYKNGS